MHLYLKILENKAKKYENNLKSYTEAESVDSSQTLLLKD